MCAEMASEKRLELETIDENSSEPRDVGPAEDGGHA